MLRRDADRICSRPEFRGSPEIRRFIPAGLGRIVQLR